MDTATTTDTGETITERQQEEAIGVGIGALLGAWRDTGARLLDSTGRTFPLQEYLLTHLKDDPGESPRHIPAVRHVIGVLGAAVDDWEQREGQRAHRGEEG